MKATARRPRPGRRPRGSAAVELSIMCVVLVPLMMYVSFLQDALLFKLDGQEAAISAPYDFMTQGYDDVFEQKLKVDPEEVGKQNRRTHCDHTAAYNTYSDAIYDCGAKGDPEKDTTAMHHYGEWSVHQCWLVKGASQVHCKWDGTGVPGRSLAVQAWAARYNQGGIASCSARIGIMNYYLPNKFFEFWSKQSVTGDSGGKARLQNFADQGENLVHDTARKKANSGNAMVLPKDSLAMVADPWALNHIEPYGPDKDAPITTWLVPGLLAPQYHPLLDRAGMYYVAQAENETSATDFRSKADAFLSYFAEIDGVGDSPLSLPIRYAAERTRAGGDGFASGWKDSRQSDMDDARAENYFGLTDASSDGAP